MSKLMRELKEAEQRRKAEENPLAAERDGEAAALAWLAEEMRGTAKATEAQETQREAQEVARRRADAEAAAVEQARARLKAEIAARALTLERVALERDNERQARQRQEAEELTLAEAQRREQAAVDLRTAIAARLKRETQAKAVAEARVASEQAALQAANEKIQLERSLEATSLSRIAAERDATYLAEQRAAREAEAARAKAARIEADSQLRQATAAAQQATEELDNFDHPTVLIDPDTTELAEAAAPPPRPPFKGIGVAAGLVAGIALGWLSVGLFGSPEAPPPVAQPAPTAIAAAHELRLDTDVEAFASRAATADFQDSSRRLVNPSATQ